MPITVFDVKGIPATRRERIETAVVAGGAHTAVPYEAWIASDPFRAGFRVLITGRTGSSGRRCSPPMTSLRLSRTGFGRRLRRNSRADIDGWLCQGGRIPGCLQTLYRRNAWPLDRARLDANLREGSLSCLRGATENGGLQRPGGSRDTPPGTAPNRRRRLEDCKGSIS